MFNAVREIIFFLSHDNNYKMILNRMIVFGIERQPNTIPACIALCVTKL